PGDLWWRLGAMALAIALALVVAVPPAAAVPGGPDDSDGTDVGAQLKLLAAENGPLTQAGSGKVGVLNTSGANAQRDVQINDPLLDGFAAFPGSPPIIETVQSETSIASSGNDIAVGYNSSAGRVFTDPTHVSQFLFSGYSVSHDGGATWQSGFVPAAPDSVAFGAPATFGDPVLGSDRQGKLYYVTLNEPGLQINTSTDGGRTWGPGETIAQDPAADKPWLAIGPDPAVPGHDNLYVTWTHLKRRSSQLWMSRSTDGGITWSTPQVLYAPVATSLMSAKVQFSNPVVDPSTGRLYIPFLHFSTTDADDVRVLVSDDAGSTFRLLKFNVPGAPDDAAFPNVTPGSLTDCGSFGGSWLTLHQGSATVGRFGLPRWIQATRISTQPVAAAANGRLFIALNSSTSSTYGDGTGSTIRLLYSPDGGQTWADPVTAAPSTPAQPQHVLPALTVDPTGTDVHIVYYTQGASSRIGVDSVNGTVGPAGVSFDRAANVAAPFDLPPTNITISPSTTLSYDSIALPCYALGDYTSAAQTTAGPVAAWGGDRQRFKEPPGALISGVHAQPDVFFGGLP
ncbi:MAG: hypothetical protein ACYDAD_15730, partial [Acidimicrobiales bacterium]